MIPNVYTFGLYVSHFVIKQSIIVIILNDEPVATRYHFENDLSAYLPTITFDNGPIRVECTWNANIATLPYFYKNNQISWIKPGKDYCIKLEDDIYENIQKTEDMPIQCSFPLSRSLPQYNCIQMEVSNEGNGASVGIASCSPVKPTLIAFRLSEVV